MPIRAYAICILIGIAAAYWLSLRRWRARGGTTETLESVILWAVPFGLVGARIYYVIIEWENYFGPGADPISALYVWEGGLGIWGAVAFGALGAWIGCRRSGARFLSVADTVAPGLLLAQAIGRLGNYFNQELFGRPTELPWGLMIDPERRPPGFEQFATFHPTFLYEIVWNLLLAAVLLLADRRFELGRGKVFALYLIGYSLGRLFIESLRIDPVTLIAGIRINSYFVGATLLLGLVWFIWLVRNRPGREPAVEKPKDEGDSPQAVVAPTGDAAEKSQDEGGDPQAAATAAGDADEAEVGESEPKP